MFEIAERDRAYERVLEIAAADERVVAGAVVGSLAHGGGDRWSDVDLTFGVADGLPVAEVLDDWAATLADELDAVQLFDLAAGATTFRVFLLPGALQLDLSCTPASAFGATGPQFRLLFGEAVGKPRATPPPSAELFGYGVHHALRARFCIERGRCWQAEHWIAGLRGHALRLACRRAGLPEQHGRGYDDLPPDVLDGLRDALPRSLDRDELLRALGSAIDGLLRASDDAGEVAAAVEPQLRALTADRG